MPTITTPYTSSALITYPGKSSGEVRNEKAFAAILDDGSIKVWGDASYGGSASATVTGANGATSTTVAELTNIVALYSTGRAFAAIDSSGQLYVWGDADFGGDATSNLTSGADLTTDVVKTVYSTSTHFAALLDDGSVVTWGTDYFQALDADYFTFPSSQVTGVDSIVTSGGAFAALKTDGTVVTWGFADAGADSSGVDFDGDGDASTTGGSLTVTSIYATETAFAAIRSDGSVVAWGNASEGGSTTAVSSLLDGSTDVTAIYSTERAFAAINSDGAVITWGSSSYGGDAAGDLTDSGSDGIADELSSGVSSIVSTGSAFAALLNDNSVVTWGDTSNGGSNNSGLTLDSVSSIYATRYAFAALNSDGSVYTWGNATYGGAADDDLADLGEDGIADLLDGTVDVTKIFATDGAFAAIRTDGSVVTWGDAAYGGDSTTNTSLAALLNGTTDVVSISATDNAFTAIRADGSLVTWGGGVTDGAVSLDVGSYATSLADVSDDQVAPTISSVSATDDTYIVGETVSITVTFSEAVTVSGGTPSLVLSNSASATYASGSGTTSLVFTYAVEEGQTDATDLAISSVSLNSATIQDAAGNDAVLTIGSNDLATGNAVVVDANTPSITAVSIPDAAMKVGDTVTATITVSGATGETLVLESSTIGGFTLGSLTKVSDTSYTATFTVTDGGTDVAADASIPVSVTLSDPAGNTSSEFTTAITGGSSDAIDANKPDTATITGPADGTYVVDDDLVFTVDFSEAVVVSGTPRLLLSNGAYASYSSSNASTDLSAGTLAFVYTVAEGDTDASDLTVATNGLQLNGGTIQDAAGNDATLTLTSAFDSAVVVDANSPTASVDSTTSDGSFKVGGSINITVTFDEAVTLSGESATLSARLETGSTDRDVALTTADSGTTWTGTYVVQSGDISGDLTVSTLVLGGSGATLRDSSGNDASLSIADGSNLADSQAFVIDTTAPSAPTNAIDLATASDTGSSTSDNKTSDTSPTLRVDLTGTNAAAGDTVELLLDGSSLDTPVTKTLTSDDITATYVDLTVTDGDLDVDGTKTFTARVTDVAGNVGVAGGSLSVTLDTQYPYVLSNALTLSTTDSAGTAKTDDLKAGDKVVLSVLWKGGDAAGDLINLPTGNNDTVIEVDGAGVDATWSTSGDYLKLTYTVASGDDGIISINESGLRSILNTANISDAAGNSADITTTFLTVTSPSNVVDTTAPSIAADALSVRTYASDNSTTKTDNLKAGDKVWLIIDLGESAEGLVNLPARNSTNNTIIKVDGSGVTGTWTTFQDTLRLTYTVLDGEDGAITIDEATLRSYLDGLSITDDAGNDLTIAATFDDPGDPTNSVDTSAPSISSATFNFGSTLNATEDDSSGILTVTTAGVEDGETVTLTLNSQTYTATTSGNSATITVGASALQALSEGTVNFTVDVDDEAGNSAPQHSGSFTYDLTLIEGFIYDWSSQKAVTGVNISNGALSNDDVNNDASFVVDKSGNSGADAYSFTASVGDGLSSGDGGTGSGVDINDALLAFKMAFRSISDIDSHEINPYQYYAADMDENGYVDIRDAMSIYSMALGRDSAPDVEWIFIDEAVDFWNDVGNNYSISGDAIDWSIVGKAQSAAAGSVSFVAVQKGDINGSWAADNDGGEGEGDAAASLTALARLDALATAGVITDVTADKWWV